MDAIEILDEMIAETIAECRCVPMDAPRYAQRGIGERLEVLQQVKRRLMTENLLDEHKAKRAHAHEVERLAESLFPFVQAGTIRGNPEDLELIVHVILKGMTPEQVETVLEEEREAHQRMLAEWETATQTPWVRESLKALGVPTTNENEAAYYLVGKDGRRRYDDYEMARRHAKILDKPLYAMNARHKCLWVGSYNADERDAETEREFRKSLQDLGVELIDD